MTGILIIEVEEETAFDESSQSVKSESADITNGVQVSNKLLRNYITSRLPSMLHVNTVRN